MKIEELKNLMKKVSEGQIILDRHSMADDLLLLYIADPEIRKLHNKCAKVEFSQKMEEFTQKMEKE